jgi:hypothetical protein
MSVLTYAALYGTAQHALLAAAGLLRVRRPDRSVAPAKPDALPVVQLEAVRPSQRRNAQLMVRWRDHLPVTTSTLLPVLEKDGGAEFSLVERALFMAGEFWIAAATGTLVTHLGTAALDRLRYMGIVYSAIGAPGVARAVITAACDLKRAPTPQGHLTCLIALQDRLVSTNDPVDRLIAHLVQSLEVGADGHSHASVYQNDSQSTPELSPMISASNSR